MGLDEQVAFRLFYWPGTGRAEPDSVARRQKARLLPAAQCHRRFAPFGPGRSPTPSYAGKRRDFLPAAQVPGRFAPFEGAGGGSACVGVKNWPNALKMQTCPQSRTRVTLAIERGQLKRRATAAAKEPIEEIYARTHRQAGRHRGYRAAARQRGS